MIENKDTEKNLIASEVEEEHAILSLPPKMQRFIHLYNTGQYTQAQLAELLEVHPNTIGKWLKRKEVRDIIDEMQVTTHDMVGMQLKALTKTAVDKLAQLTNSPIDGVALQAVKDILDRAGHKPKQEIKIDKRVVTFEEKLTNLINNTIEADYEVVDDE